MTAEDDGLKIYGLGVQRVGSTWLMSLLQENVTAEEAQFAQSHVPVQPEEGGRYVMLMRDPWAWLVSFYRFQLHPVWGWIDRAWNKIVHPPVDDFRAARWWNSYLLSYEHWEATLPEDRTVFLRYEDLIPDPDPALGEALDEIGVPRRDPVQNYREYRKDFSSPLAKVPWIKPKDLPTKTFDPTYYTEKRYLQEYRPDHMRKLYWRASKRDLPERFEHFGYDLSADVPDA